MTHLRTIGLLILARTQRSNKGGVRKVVLAKTLCAVFALGVTAAIGSSAQTVTTLASFTGLDGDEPHSSLVQGTDGNFYGTTNYGGPNAMGGTAFDISPGGALTTLYAFCGQYMCSDGEHSIGGVIQASDGNFYGTTQGGGVNDNGTVFQLTPDGTFTTLYFFGGKDGSAPTAPLIQAANGNLYGTTTGGGRYGAGTIFKMTLAGKLTRLHSFNGADGANPVGMLVQATDGNFYGTTSGGAGTVFEITPAGTLTTLHTFSGADGYSPVAGLVQAFNGNFYGTTSSGGANGDGTVFEITPTGTLTVLHNFAGYWTDGANPGAGLVEATDRNFYGTTTNGGGTGGGTVFKITPGGSLSTLYSFDWWSGDLPYSGLLQATDGAFYGTTGQGGTDCCGTVYRLSMGLDPFAKTEPASGKVGAPVVILGTNLAGTTAVTFHGAPAVFTVVSSSEITTEVPAGASTGKVRVTTLSGTIESNVPFRVQPQITRIRPTSGSVGTQVQIIGVSLRQTTEVTFGGVASTEFSVNSDKQVTATVPASAVTGPITIATMGGTARSTQGFTVTE
ncbi:MAG: choice-of-anchor tandem repeat GloVer-containing protein [Terriglobales bacterium]